MTSKAARKVSQRVSEAFDSGDLKAAASGLVDLSQVVSADAAGAKLGSLQRWTRLAGQLDAGDLTNQVLWLLCRVAEGVSTAAPAAAVAVRRRVPWEPRPLAGDGAPPPPPPPRPPAPSKLASHFLVVRREKAADRQPPNRHDLEIWASRPGSTADHHNWSTEPILLEVARVIRHDHPSVPGAFVCVDVLTPGECDELLGLAMALGFQRDEPLDFAQRATSVLAQKSAFDCLADSDDESDPDDDDDAAQDEGGARARPPPRAAAAAARPETGTEAEKEQARADQRSRAVVWVVDEELNAAVFERLRAHLPQTYADCCDAQGRAVGPGALCGLNRRWRFYKYEPGGTYRPHVDGAWPASALGADGASYVYDCHGDRLSRLTCLFYLNEGFEGGETAFYSAPGPDEIAVDLVAPRQGALLFFPHGDARGSLIHEGSTVRAGVKYVVRTEVLYKWEKPPPTDHGPAHQRSPSSSASSSSTRSMPLPSDRRGAHPKAAKGRGRKRK